MMKSNYIRWIVYIFVFLPIIIFLALVNGVEMGILIGCLVFLIVYIIRLLRNKIAIKIEVFPPSAEDNNSYVHTKVDRENDPVVMDISSRTSKPSNQLHESSHLLLDSTETGDNRNENRNQRLMIGKSVFANQTNSQDQYLSSVKGVYDGTKEHRHVVKDVTNENCQIHKKYNNINSHTVDDVYDVSGDNKKPDEGSYCNYQ